VHALKELTQLLELAENAFPTVSLAKTESAAKNVTLSLSYKENTASKNATTDTKMIKPSALNALISKE